AGDETIRAERIDSWSHPTIIDGEKRGRCFACEHRTVIDGFVIQNGRDWSAGEGKGAAILAYNNDVQIRNNLIQNNVDSWAGAVFIDGFETRKNVAGAAPLIENNVFINNFSIYCAAAIEMRGSTATVRHNTIVKNQGFGLEIQPLLGQLPQIIYGDFYNNIITNNVRLEPNDVWGEARKVSNYSYVGCRWSLNGEFGTYNYGKENIFGDATGQKPGFIDEKNRDFRLRADSPCIDAGNPTSSADPDGTRPDLGAFPFHHHQPELKIAQSGIFFDSNISEQKLTLSAYGGKPTPWRIAAYSPAGEIISAKPQSGVLRNGERIKITINVDPSRLANGIYDGHLAVMTPWQSVETKLSIVVNRSMPEIMLSRTPLEIEAIMEGPKPAPRQIAIRNAGSGGFTWTAQKKLNSDWLLLRTAAGKAGDDLTIEFNTTGLRFGEYHEIIRIDAPAAINKTVDFPVMLKMNPRKFVYEIEAEKSPSLPNIGWSVAENNGTPCLQSLKNNIEMPDENTRIDYEFDVPDGVEYVYVFAEINMIPERNKISYWAMVNGYDLCPWDYIIPPNKGWFRSWIYHKMRDEQHTFVVMPGKNKLNLSSRERGGFINWVVITNDPEINIETYRFGTQQKK
ncbi:MAG: right-handed parallel beta-helix repeat-containing protein, partial [bacterium]|nr:right-handed parallel beta-helix repeat-containing protein [bacterium]